MFGVWAAPGAPETLAKGGELRLLKGLQVPQGHADPKNDRFPSWEKGFRLC